MLNPFEWQVGTQTLTNADRTLVMGILNVTPDSFSDGGSLADANAAIEHGLAMREAGADIVDVGGESTRPGSDPVSAEEELRRVIPVVGREDRVELQDLLVVLLDRIEQKIVIRGRLGSGRDCRDQKQEEHGQLFRHRRLLRDRSIMRCVSARGKR